MAPRRLLGLGLVLLVQCSSSLAVATTLPTEAAVRAAFAKDGIELQEYTLCGNAGFGARGSANVTLWTTGAKKDVFMLGGDGYDMGYCYGQLAADHTRNMTQNYINNMVPGLISEGLPAKLRNNSFAQWLLNGLGDVISQHAFASFNTSVAEGAYPAALVQEMHGIADGASSVLGAGSVTMERVASLNVALDYIVSQLLTGNILSVLFGAAEEAVQRGVVRGGDVEEARSLITPHDFNFPSYCDAFGVSGAATTDGQSSYYARDLQLPTAGIYQDLAAVVVYLPTDGRMPVVSVAGPGLVGGLTLLNTAGVAVGVDTLRTARANAEVMGINSVLLLRAVIHEAGSAAEAVADIASSRRGVPYLYSIADAGGAAFIVEAEEYTESTTPPNSLVNINDTKLLAALPDWDTIMASTPDIDFRTGVYVRNTSWAPPSSLLAYNPALFELGGYPYNASSWGYLGSIFPNFTVEDESWHSLGMRYFPPARKPPSTKGNVVAVTNTALSPQVAVGEMAFWPGVFPGESIQWRYDTLMRRLVTLANQGAFDYQVAKDTILFLDPWNTPNYWKQRADPDEPGSTVIEGALAAVDLQAGQFAAKTGYYGDDWLEVNLGNYAGLV